MDARFRQLLGLPTQVFDATVFMAELMIQIRAQIETIELESVLDAIKPEARRVMSDISAMRGSVEHIETQVDTLTARLEAVGHRVDEMQGLLDHLVDQLDAAADKVPEGPIHKLKNLTSSDD